MHLKGVIICVICISVVFIYLIIRYVICANKNINPKYNRMIGYSAMFALIVGFIIGRSIMWFSPRILVIEPDKSHYYEYAIFDFKNNFHIRSTYLKNNTNMDLYLTKHVYVAGYITEHDTPKTYTIPSQDIVMIKKVPYYFFEGAPGRIKSKAPVKQTIRWEINDH